MTPADALSRLFGHMEVPLGRRAARGDTGGRASRWQPAVTGTEHGRQRGWFSEAETLQTPAARAWGRGPPSPPHTHCFRPALPPVSALVSGLVVPSVTDQAHTEQLLFRRGLVPSDHPKALSL